MQLSDAVLGPGRNNDSATLQVDVRLECTTFEPRMFLQAAVAVDDADYVELGPNNIRIPQLDIGADQTTINNYTFHNAELLDAIRKSRKQVTLRINGSMRGTGSAYVYLSTSRVRRDKGRKRSSIGMLRQRNHYGDLESQQWNHQSRQRSMRPPVQHLQYQQQHWYQSYDVPVMSPVAAVAVKEEASASNEQPYLSALLNSLRSKLPSPKELYKSTGNRTEKRRKTNGPVLVGDNHPQSPLEYCPEYNWQVVDELL